MENFQKVLDVVKWDEYVEYLKEGLEEQGMLKTCFSMGYSLAVIFSILLVVTFIGSLLSELGLAAIAVMSVIIIVVTEYGFWYAETLEMEKLEFNGKLVVVDNESTKELIQKLSDAIDSVDPEKDTNDMFAKVEEDKCKDGVCPVEKDSPTETVG